MSTRSVAQDLVRDHGQTFAEECGIDLSRGTPGPLWQLLCAAVLYGAPISPANATRAARGLRKEGLRTARRMRDSSWEERVRILDEAGYTRYDERTATMLADLAGQLEHDYGGDLRKLRERAGRDPDTERSLLEQGKGVGDVGVDIFFREAQVVWDELRPFADRRALRAAESRGLPLSAEELQDLVGPRDMPRLVAALVRVGPAGDGRAANRGGQR
jgi:hypothetical protein